MPPNLRHCRALATTSSNSQMASASQNPIFAMFAEYNSCPQHRGLILSLSTIIQNVALRCPGALVWHDFGEEKTNPILCGSPLDLLPCPPSLLPMPPRGEENQQVSEGEIIRPDIL